MGFKSKSLKCDHVSEKAETEKKSVDQIQIRAGKCDSEIELKENNLKEYIHYLIQKNRFTDVIDLSDKMAMDKKFDYDSLILSYEKVGNTEMEKKLLLDYFSKFPSKNILDKLILILNDNEIEEYRSKIICDSMKSNETFKEACMRIGNVDDLYFLLLKGNLKLSDRVHILTNHTDELYKKDADGMLHMLKKDLMSIIQACNISETLLQEVVFALSKFKRGRDILNGLLIKLDQKSNKMDVKKLIYSVMEESSYVYNENYEAKSWN